MIPRISRSSLSSFPNCLLWFLLFFFFSSRRRHTRSKRDWSSDVCSSDLAVNKGESLYDSILTMKALGMDIAVIRHQNNAYYKDLLDIGLSIVNAGSGSGE